MVKAKNSLKKSVKKAIKKPAKKLVKKSVKKATKISPIKKNKSKKVSAIPKGYHSITPYLIVDQAEKAIAFYEKAFGAKVAMLIEKDGNKIGHAELKIGDSKIMLADEHPELSVMGPQSCHRSPVGIHLYVKDVDAVIARAIAAGAIATRPVMDMFYGDRSGGLQDPFGHCWYIATHIEDVTLAQMKKRMAQMNSDQ